MRRHACQLIVFCRTAVERRCYPLLVQVFEEARNARRPTRQADRRDLAPELRGWVHADARETAAEWRRARAKLEDPGVDRRAMDIWLREQRRAFAIETGQIEGLYLLRRGVTETLIAEGFEGVRGAHSATSISDDTLRGLLTDQEAALEMLFAHVKEERKLTARAIREWHAVLTYHQARATGLDLYGRQVEIPLRRGQFKAWSNNPRRLDGFVHEFCPPEHVESEVERFLAFHEGHRELGLAPELEAAWLHHEFVRIHPFQDGNGRVSRLLMAYPFIKAGEFPPIIAALTKDDYIIALERADSGEFLAFARYLGRLAAGRSAAAAERAWHSLSGNTHYRHANGAVTNDGVYYPPPDQDRPEEAKGRRTRD